MYNSDSFRSAASMVSMEDMTLEARSRFSAGTFDVVESVTNYTEVDNIETAIVEIADMAAEQLIYKQDQLEFLRRNPDAVNAVLSAHSFKGDPDALYTAIQVAAIEQAEKELSAHVPDLLRIYAAAFVRYDLGRAELPEAIWDSLAEDIGTLFDAGTFETFGDVQDLIHETLDVFAFQGLIAAA